MQETIQQLKKDFTENPIFQFFNQKEFDYFLSLTQSMDYKAGDVIFRTGQVANGFYIILKGKVRVEREKAGAPVKTLAELSAPTVLGEMGLLSKRVRTSTAVAEEPTAILFFDRNKFNQLLHEDDLMAFKLSHNLGSILSEKMEAMNNAVMDMKAKFKEFTQFKHTMFSDWNF